MNKIVILIIRLIIPLVILFLAFTWLGTTGGIILAVLYLPLEPSSVIHHGITSIPEG